MQSHLLGIGLGYDCSQAYSRLVRSLLFVDLSEFEEGENCDFCPLIVCALSTASLS